MRLARFIEQAREEIIAESLAYAAQIPALRGAEARVLRNHLPLVLKAISRDLDQPQSRAASIEKSLGNAPASLADTTAAETHGLERARSGLNIEQVVAEYRVLRSCVLRLWADACKPDSDVIADTMRFNEAIDQAVAESVAFHASETARWRDLFLGVLGHDLRNPLTAMLLTAEVLTRETSGKAAEHAQALLRNGRRMSALLNTLLDYNQSSLGTGMKVQRELVDLRPHCEDEVDMLRRAFPESQFHFSAAGDAHGRFDVVRVREALTNLVSNAVQHSSIQAPVHVSLEGQEEWVVLNVENVANPIDPEVLASLFEPLRRLSKEGRPSSGNLGLGLFIVREIATAHGGNVSATMVGDRIRFKLVLPRQ